MKSLQLLSWCAYCQRFIGEVPEYRDFAITHGICRPCAARFDSLTDADLANANRLKELQEGLREQGLRGDVEAAEAMMEQASRNDIRPVDILLGLTAPLLYRIGEDWERGHVTVAQEHRFTAFCEAVFERLSARLDPLPNSEINSDRRERALLLQAPGNSHRFGLRVLGLWLRTQGIDTELVDQGGLDELAAAVRNTKPRFVLISMALAEQQDAVSELAARVADLSLDPPPTVVVGGNAVKVGLVEAIPNAILLPDISALAPMLQHRRGAGPDR